MTETIRLGEVSIEVSRKDTKPAVTLGHKRIRLAVRPGSHEAQRAMVMHEWHKSLLHQAVPPLLRTFGSTPNW